MTKNTNSQTTLQHTKPHPALERLNVLIGTWNMRGHTLDVTQDNISGWNTFEWLPGGFFLKSTGEINFKGEILQSLEIIGYDPETDCFPSTVYSSIDGNALPYSWDVQGNTVIHSDATSQYTGTFTDNGKTLTGGWRPMQGEKEVPGNSYDAVLTRIK